MCRVHIGGRSADVSTALHLSLLCPEPARYSDLTYSWVTSDLSLHMLTFMMKYHLHLRGWDSLSVPDEIYPEEVGSGRCGENLTPLTRSGFLLYAELFSQYPLCTPDP